MKREEFDTFMSQLLKTADAIQKRAEAGERVSSRELTLARSNTKLVGDYYIALMRLEAQGNQSADAVEQEAEEHLLRLRRLKEGQDK